MMLGALALTLTLAPIQGSETVTYQTVAKRADLVIEELAQASGVALQTGKDAESHYLVLDLHDAPFNEALARIAEVTLCEWTETAEGLILEPDETARAQNERQVLDARAKRIEEFLSEQEGGIQAAIVALAQSIGARELAKIPVGGRGVWSLTPTQMQHKLRGPGAHDAIQSVIERHNQNLPVAPPANISGEPLWAFLEAYGILSAPSEEISEIPPEVLLVASRGHPNYGDWLTVELRLYNDDGKRIFAIQEVLLRDNADQHPPQSPDDAETDLIEWGENTMLVFEAVSDYSPDAVAGLRETIGDPLRVEPLSLWASDILLSIAASRKKQLVANAPDAVANPAQLLPTWETMTVASAIEVIESTGSLSLSFDGEWLIAAPVDAAEARNRVSREAVKRLSDAYGRTDTAPLDEIAEYVVTAGPLLELNAPNAVAMMMVPAEMLDSAGDWAMLRLWAELSAHQRRLFRRGEGLRVSGLGADAKRNLAELLFGAFHGLMERQVAERSAGIEPMAYLSLVGATDGRTLWTEPTEAMPRGLPPNGEIFVEITREPYLLAVEPNRMPGGGYLGFEHVSAHDLASWEFAATYTPGRNQASFEDVVTKLRYGERTTMEFTFVVAPNSVARHTLIEDGPPSDESVDWNELPQEIIDHLRAVKQSYAETPYAQLFKARRERFDDRVDPP